MRTAHAYPLFLDVLFLSPCVVCKQIAYCVCSHLEHKPSKLAAACLLVAAPDKDMPLIRKCSLYTDADIVHALSFVKPLAERLPVNESCHPHIHRLQAELPACDLHTLQVRVPQNCYVAHCKAVVTQNELYFCFLCTSASENRELRVSSSAIHARHKLLVRCTILRQCPHILNCVLSANRRWRRYRV